MGGIACGLPVRLRVHRDGDSVRRPHHNAVVLTAVLSCLNSGMYTASRMLFVLAARREAPPQLVRVTRRGVPAIAILTSSVVGFLCGAGITTCRGRPARGVRYRSRDVRCPMRPNSGPRTCRLTATKSMRVCGPALDCGVLIALDKTFRGAGRGGQATTAD